MAASKETVYIKADRNVEVTDPCVKLGDILSMECANPTVLPKLKTIKLLRFHGVDKKTQNRGRGFHFESYRMYTCRISGD